MDRSYNDRRNLMFPKALHWEHSLSASLEQFFYTGGVETKAVLPLDQLSPFKLFHNTTTDQLRDITIWLQILRRLIPMLRLSYNNAVVALEHQCARYTFNGGKLDSTKMSKI